MTGTLARVYGESKVRIPSSKFLFICLFVLFIFFFHIVYDCTYDSIEYLFNGSRACRNAAGKGGELI